MPVIIVNDLLPATDDLRQAIHAHKAYRLPKVHQFKL